MCENSNEFDQFSEVIDDLSNEKNLIKYFQWVREEQFQGMKIKKNHDGTLYSSYFYFLECLQAFQYRSNT